MGKITGFKEFERREEGHVDVKERIQHYNEFTVPLKKNAIEKQGSRCMDCGIPFCHSACPLGNLIPDFNDMVHKGEWKKALDILHATNNFPEFTGRLCPAPCEQACVLGIIKPPITIENLEKNIVEKGFSEGWITAEQPLKRTGKKVAVVGSGPAGLATAQQLNRAGHSVIVFERDDAIGGLLRYGIPNFKLEKEIIDRRIDILKEEGIEFKTNVNVGVNYEVDKLKNFDAVVLCGGATQRRSLPINGINSKGVVQAMTFLKQQNKRCQNIKFDEEDIFATDKHVIVIGGGDTGSDCVGTSNRHGALSVTNFEIMPKPPTVRSEKTPWPFWPLKLNTSTSHEEGCDRHWSILTKEFISDNKGHVKGLKVVDIKWAVNKNTGRAEFKEVPGTERTLPCDLALLSIGFIHPEHDNAIGQLEISVDDRGNVIDTEYQTNKDKVFTAGDMRRGQSLVVWAIAEGREAARSADRFLMGEKSLLEAKDESLWELA